MYQPPIWLALFSRFCCSAPTLCNSLPHSVHFCESLTTFRKHLKTFYFQAAFSGTLCHLPTNYPSSSDSVCVFFGTL